MQKWIYTFCPHFLRNWFGRKFRVHLTRFSHDNTINWEEEIHSLVLSHSLYRITPEGFCTLEYDYSAIEREIAEKVGIGKPEITDVTEIPQVVWQKGVTSIRTKMRVLLKSKTLVQVIIVFCLQITVRIHISLL